MRLTVVSLLVRGCTYGAGVGQDDVLLALYPSSASGGPVAMAVSAQRQYEPGRVDNVARNGDIAAVVAEVLTKREVVERWVKLYPEVRSAMNPCIGVPVGGANGELDGVLAATLLPRRDEDEQVGMPIVQMKAHLQACARAIGYAVAAMRAEHGGTDVEEVHSG